MTALFLFPTQSGAAVDFAIRDAQLRLSGSPSDLEARQHPSMEVDLHFGTSDGGLYTNADSNNNTPNQVDIQFPIGAQIDLQREKTSPACTYAQLEAEKCPADSRLGTILLETRHWWFSPVPWPIWGWGFNTTRTGELYRVQVPDSAGFPDTKRVKVGYVIPGYASYGARMDPKFTKGLMNTNLTVDGNRSHRSSLFLQFGNYGKGDASWPPYPDGTPRVIRSIVDRIKITLDGRHPDGSPLVTLPSRCDKSLDVRVEARTFRRSYADPSSGYLTAEKMADSRFLPAACDSLKFSPQLAFDSSTHPHPTLPPFLLVNEVLPSYTYDVQQGTDESAIARSQISLPEGFRVAGLFRDAKDRCTVGQFNVADQSKQAECPATSQIGKAVFKGTVDSSNGTTHDHPNGKIYLGETKKTDDQVFTYRTKVFFDIDSGTLRYPWLSGDKTEEPYFRYKAVGDLLINKNSGQATLVFGDRTETSGMVQLLSSQMRFEFNDFIIAPNACGAEQKGTGLFTPWAAAPTFAGGRDSSTTVVHPHAVRWSTGGTDCPAKRPFLAELQGAKTENTQANGQTGAVDLSVKRFSPRTEEKVKDLKITFPAGMKLDLSSITECSEPNILARRCPTSSLVGPLKWYGLSNPLRDHYLTEGGLYVTKITPTSAELVADLPNPTTGDAPELRRGKLELNGGTSRIELSVTDLPKDLNGIPLLLSDLDFHLNDHRLLTNPTKCDPTAFEFEALSHDGSTTTNQISWKATGC